LGEIKNSKYSIFRVLFLLGVQSEVISESVLKGVFLVDNGGSVGGSQNHSTVMD